MIEHDETFFKEKAGFSIKFNTFLAIFDPIQRTPASILDRLARGTGLGSAVFTSSLVLSSDTPELVAEILGTR